MKLLAYTVDLHFPNTPAVHAEVLLTNEDTGEETTASMRFHDDDARAITVLVPDPGAGRTGLIATGPLDHDALADAIANRLAEARELPKAITDRIAAADKARVEQREAQATKAALDVAIAAGREEAAALDAASARQRDALAAELAAAQAEIATAREAAKLVADAAAAAAEVAP